MTLTLWYVARGSGIVSLALFTMTFALGLLTAGRVTSPSWPRFVTETLHRNLSMAAVTFIVVHVLTIVFDTYVTIRPLEALVPFIGTYSPLFLGLGTLAFDIILTLIITGLLRARMPYRAWRLVHWIAYLGWPVAVVHGVFIGTDQMWVLVTAGVSVAIVVACGGFRVAALRRRSL
ncbi:ferric reductase-like transmembrane domain-containing protein [Actinocrispum wychmicini]|uniref:Ferric reductase like protein n=1 Tax=Actinocrispum wychmicini TaxID=1213861 RepID=A0A4R2J4K5_9PSEU|nr:ferric reductase-like transmembrane domain-containing protein [Actinocrispum wychmicini]TCO53661.1 ferric reductase like protein [Actinocrispum wychmicini]